MENTHKSSEGVVKSIPTPSRTFKSYFKEMKMILHRHYLQSQGDISKSQAELYYNGGYSPKNAILNHFNVPVSSWVGVENSK